MTRILSTGWPDNFRPDQIQIKLVHSFAFGIRPMSKGFVELELAQEMPGPNGPYYRRMAMMILAPQEAKDLCTAILTPQEDK